MGKTSGVSVANTALLVALIASTVGAVSVSLISPSNTSTVAGPNVSFVFIAVSNTMILNASLFSNFSGAYTQNASITTVANNTATTLTAADIAPGYYLWNIQPYENSTPNNYSFATANFSLTVLAPPTPVTPTPTPTPIPTNTISAPQLPTPLSNPTCGTLFDESVLAATTVTQGTQASFPIVLSNKAAAQLTLSLAVTCDPKSMICSLSDVPFPNLFGLGEQRIHHLVVDTSQTPAGTYYLPLEVSTDTATGTCLEQTNLVLNVQPRNPPLVEGPAVRAYLNPTTPQLGRAGEVLEYTIGLVNEGSERALVNLESRSNPFAQTTTIESSEVSLEPGEARTLRAQVRVPSGVLGGTYYIPFVANWMTATRGPFDILLPATVRTEGPFIALQLQPEPTLNCMPVNSNSPLTVKAKMVNAGYSKGTLVSTLEGDESARQFITLNRDLFELKAGESIPLEIAIAPERTTALGNYYYHLIVKNLDFTIFDRALCAKVASVSNVTIETPDKVTLLRARTTTVPVVIHNIGNIRDDYAMELTVPRNVVASSDPATFTLLPDQSKTVNVVLQTSLRTALGDGDVTVTVRSKTAPAVKAQFKVSVESSNQSGESYLTLDNAPTIEVVDGVEKDIELAVTNTGPELSQPVSLTILGIPSTWYTAIPRNIGAGKTENIPLTIHASKPQRDRMAITLDLSSGLERVRYPGTLTIDPQVRRLVAGNLSAQAIRDGGTPREMLVTVTLRNTGNTPASDVQPILFSDKGELDNELFAVSDTPIDLQPGESQTLNLRIRPASSTSREKTSVLRLQSSEGAQASQEIKLPSLQGKGAGGIPWTAVIIVVVLLIAIFAYLARQEYWFGRTPPREGEENRNIKE